ncbi:MAG: hypothetical protein MJ149_01860 [Clostridia bacterium]|nr:hypothetical protein [Clostridia bacterium]
MTKAKELLQGKITFKQDVLGLVKAMTKESYKTPKNESILPKDIEASKKEFAKNEKKTANLIAELYKAGEDLTSAMQQLAPKSQEVSATM